MLIVRSSFFKVSISGKVHIFSEGHKILRNLHLTFDWHYIGQNQGGHFAKFSGLIRIYELQKVKSKVLSIGYLGELRYYIEIVASLCNVIEYREKNASRNNLVSVVCLGHKNRLELQFFYYVLYYLIIQVLHNSLSTN